MVLLREASKKETWKPEDREGLTSRAHPRSTLPESGKVLSEF
jgi:hypothetical protein